VPDLVSSLHCLTVDVEEHFQASSFDTPELRCRWDTLESRVERNTNVVLDFLAARETQATFFVLGYVAERNPDLLRAIAAAGHEVASHGYAHEMITGQTPERFREDVRRARGILGDLTGQEIAGYRAPSFTITRKTLWALPILAEEGHAYDSSIVPVVHDRYGVPGAPAAPYRLETPSGTLYEIPPSTVSLGPTRVPVGGGGYLRLYPFPLFRWFLDRASATGDPLVLYVHPWELDPDQPRLPGSFLSRFRQYRNLDCTQERLSRLIASRRFAPIRDAIDFTTLPDENPLPLPASAFPPGSGG
jgi:polysaccharide deacetylase family protein (PEP-CTERM system associated)